MWCKSQRPGWDEGATAVEAAITLSVTLTLVFGVIGFGYALWQWSTMMLAVEEAGRYVMINNATCGTSRPQRALPDSGRAGPGMAGSLSTGRGVLGDDH